MTQVAVQAGLTPIANALQAAGYQVIPLVEGVSLNRVGAVVLTGGNENMWGDQRTATPCPVIDASGRTPEEIVARIGRIADKA